MSEEILIYGLITSGTYAVLAVGFSLIFGSARIINLAHTAFFMLAAYFLYQFGTKQDLPYEWSIALSAVISLAGGLSSYPLISRWIRGHIIKVILLTLVVTALYGIAGYFLFEYATEHDLPLGWSIALSIIVTTGIGLSTYKLFVERIREHHVTVLLMTLALAIIAEKSLFEVFGQQGVMSMNFIHGYEKVLGVRVFNQHFIVLGTALVALIGVWIVLSKTRLGIAIRAAAQDAEVANLMGINVPRTLMITVGLATALAAFSGVVVAPTEAVAPEMWKHPLVMVMAIVILGGLGSVKGSIIAAFIIGYTEESVKGLLPEYSFLSTSIALGVMIVVLLVRPEGLFGVTFEEERL